MRKWIGALVALFVLGMADVTARADEPDPPLLHQINVSVQSGDPLGSREAGTIKLHAQPVIVTVDQQTATFMTGDGIEVSGNTMCVNWDDKTQGFWLRVTPARQQDGSIQLSVEMIQKKVVDRDGQDVSFQIDQSRYTRMVQLDEVVRLRVGKIGDTETWVDLSVTEYKR
jgi:hypothetical protein